VTSPSVTVPLDPTSVASFSGVGTTGGSAKDFNITLSCSGGTVGTSSNMYMTLTDVTSPGNTTDMLTPSTGSSAVGIGIRVFNGATAVKFGPDSSVVGNTNQWKVTTVPGNTTTNVTIPLSAKYVQMAPIIGPGDVKALATFTMAYN
jgi:type 1 fimbria pilin